MRRLSYLTPAVLVGVLSLASERHGRIAEMLDKKFAEQPAAPRSTVQW